MNEMKFHIHVIFFAHLRELSGQQKIELEIPAGTDILTLKDMMVARFPRLKPAIDTIIIAINQEFAADNVTIPDDAEVAIFPPVSGGSEKRSICRIVAESIINDDYLKMISNEETGGVCTFTGIVRAVTKKGREGKTSCIDYEAYQPMAERKMLKICGEIRDQWPDVDGIVIVQRIGLIPAGEISVLIMCSAAHRDSGIFEATRYAIDRLKEIVPVWKKEISPDGEVWIDGNYLPGEKD